MIVDVTELIQVSFLLVRVFCSDTYAKLIIMEKMLLGLY